MANTKRKVVRNSSPDRSGARPPAGRFVAPPARSRVISQPSRQGTVRLPLYFGWEIVLTLRRFGQRVIGPLKNRRRLTFTAAGTAAALILLVVFWANNTLRAATYTWIQTSWSGGATANTANHPGNQSGWNQYAAKDASVSAGSTVSLSTQSNYALDASDRDFRLGGSAVYASVWNYRKSLTIDNVVVSGGAPLTDFPLLVSITSDDNLRYTANGGGVGKSDGTDIYFTSSDGTTKLAHEIEKYVAATGELNAWVKIPSLSNSADTALYIYYGNATATDQQQATSVWDSNYKAVYHLKEDPTGGSPQFQDSTNNNNDVLTNGSFIAGDQQTAKINGGLNFPDDEFLELPSYNSSLDLLGKNLTVEAWVKPDDNDNFMHFAVKPSNADHSPPYYDWGLLRSTSGDGAPGFSVGCYGGSVYANTNAPNGVWTYVTGSYDSSGWMRIYVNATESNNFLANCNVVNTSSQKVRLGATNDPLYRMDGMMDEVRISSVARGDGWIATTYNNQNTPATYQTFGSQEVTTNAWNYRRNLTISNAVVSGSSNLTDFPFLVRIESDNDLRTIANGGSVGKSDGGDIMFTSVDGTTKLAHQIESYSPTTGALVAWVKIPTLSYTTDTVLTMYYGNANIADQQDAANVWDSSYKAVYHLKETPSGAAGEIFDSTANTNHGQTQGGMAGGNQVAGQIGGSLSFDGTDDNVTAPHSSSLEITSNLTISAWVKADDISHLIASKASGDAAANSYEYRVNTRDYYAVFNGTSYQCDTFSDCFPRASQWKYVTMTWNQSGGGTISFYENGKLIDTHTRASVIAASAAALVLAGRNDSSQARSLQGQLDEVRISNVVRSADWILTEYNNQRTSTVANGPRSQVITGLSSYRENQYGHGQRKIAYMPNAIGGPAWYVALNKVNVVQYKKCFAATLCDQDADWSAAVNVDVDGDAGDYTPTMVVDGNYIIFVWDDDTVAGTSPGSDTIDTIQMRRLDTTTDTWSAECSSAAITNVHPDALMFAGKGSNNDFIVGFSTTSGGPLGIYEVTHNWTCATEGTGFTDISGNGMTDGFGLSGDAYVSVHFFGDVASVIYKDGFGYISQSNYNVSTNSWVFGHKTIVSAYSQVSATSDGSSIWLTYWQTNGSDLRMKKCSGTCTTQLATAWTTETSPWETGLGPYFAYSANIGYISDTNEVKVCLSNYTINDSHADVWCKTSDAASISWSSAVQLGLPGGGYNDVSIPYSTPSNGFAASAVGGSSAHWFIAPEQKVKRSRPNSTSFVDAAEAQWGSNGRQVAYMPNATGGAAWYVFHADGNQIRYRKCIESTGCDADGDWSANVNVSTSTGRYNPNISVSGDTIWAAWIDDTADTIEFRSLDTSSDSLGSVCTSANQGTIDFANYAYIAAGTNGDVVVGYDSVSSDTEEALFEVASGGCSFTSIFSGSGLPDANSANLPVPVAIGNVMHFVYDDGANVINHSAYDVFSNTWVLTDQAADTGNVLDQFFSVTTDGRNLYLLYQESTDVYVIRTCTTSGGTPCMSNGGGTWSTLTSPYGSGSGLINSQWPTLTYRPSTNSLTACLIRGPGAALQDVTCRTTNATTVSWSGQTAAGFVPANLFNLSAPMISGSNRDLEVFAADATTSVLRFAVAAVNTQGIRSGDANVSGGSTTAVIGYDSGGGVALSKNGSTYSSSGTFLSRIFDTTTGGSWGNVSFSSSVPANTTLSVKVRSGNNANLSDAPAFTSGISFVQDETTLNNASAGTIAKAFGATVTTGNLIVVSVGWGSTDQTPTVTDNIGNTYTLIDKYFDTGGFNQGHATYYAKNVTGGTVTVTATFSPNVDFRRLAISEYSGADKTAPLDVHAIQRQVNPGTGTDAITSGSVVTTVANTLVYGVTQDIESAGTLVAGTGYQMREATTGTWFATEDKTQASPGSVAATFTAGTGTSNKITAVAAFKPDTTTTCTAITSGQAASTGGCVTDGHRYVQYLATLGTTDTAITPTLRDITITYVVNGLGTLTSSIYNSADNSNVLASIAWAQSGSGTVKFQFRTSPEGTTWTSWLGPTGTGDYYTDNTGAQTIHASHRDGVNDRYFQYQVSLTASGANSPSVSSISTTYVVNAPPEFQAAPTATQNADGTVAIAYSVRDPDTNAGTIDPGFVTPSFEYSTNNGSNWSPITLGLPAGTTDHKAVQQGSYTNYSFNWDAKAQLNGTYTTQAMIRITLNDQEAANNTAVNATVAYTLDVKNPTLGSPALTVNASTAPATLALNASDDSTLEMCITLDNTQTNCVAYNASSTITLATDPDTVYVIFRDNRGNTASASAVSPPTPTNMFIRDVSNPPTSEYQLFIAWAVTSLSGGQFTSYNVYHSTDGTTYNLLTAITDRTINYYFHPGLTLNTTHYYKVSTTSSAGNTSYYSTVVNAVANGQGGGSDLVAPYITNVVVGSVTTQSATITWDTDELSDSAVGYSTTPANFATEVGVGSMVDTASGVGQHTVTLTGLTPNTTYYARAKSTDPSGNTGTDANGGNGYSFTTISGPVISNVTTTTIANTSAVVTWLTNIAANSSVTYSTSPTLASPTTVNDAATTTTHSITLTGLSIGTRYYYKVASDVATDTNGGQYYSFTTTSDTTAPVISAITVNPITDTQAVVTWTTDEKATSGLSYGNTTGSYPLTVPTNTALNINHSVTLSNLTADTQYFFIVTSADGSSNSATSAEQTFTTSEKLTTESDLQDIINDSRDDTPPLISDVTATAVTDQTAVITWTTSEDATSFVQFGPNDEDQIIFGNWVYGTSHSITLRSLTPLTTYQYLVISADRSGNVSQGASATFITTAITAENLEAELEKQLEAIEGSAGSLPPPVISGQPRVDVTATTATLSWTTDKAANSLLSYATEADFTSGGYSQTVGLPDTYGTSHSITLTNLTPSTIYHYQVRSKTKLGTEAKTNDLFLQTLKKVFTIENYSADALGDDSAAFRWTTSETATATVQIAPYRNNIRAVEELRTIVDSSSSLIHQITVNDLEPAVQYSVELISVNAEGLRTSKTIDNFSTTANSLPPVITNLRVDSALSTGDKVRVQTIVSWNTNTLSTSQVLYREGVGKAGEELPKKTNPDPAFTKRHVVVLTTLAPGGVYQLVARSTDSNGQTADSKSVSFLTPQQQQSVFQVILNTFQQTFGWTNIFR